MLKLSHLIFGYVIFLIFGALIFYELNIIEEKTRHIRVKNQIQQFLTRNKHCLKEADLYHYVDYFLDKSHTGLWLSSLSKKNITKWTFGQGLFFATSLLTTVGYGTPNLITPHGKIICIIYTIVGLILALFLQHVLLENIVPILFRCVHYFGNYPHEISRYSMQRNYLWAFVFVSTMIICLFSIIPTLILHQIYVPQWSLVDLVYFAITTSYRIGFGDLMPCSDLTGESRSKCAMAMTVYVIVQVLSASILVNMWFLFPTKRLQFVNRNRHESDPCCLTMNNNRKFSIDILT